MDFMEGVAVALAGISAHKLRSFLTMLGIIVGVAAVIAMISLGEGAKRQVEQSITSLGTNLLYVRSGSAHRGGIWFGLGTTRSLTVEDAQAILGECPAVVDLAPHIQRPAQVKQGNRNWQTNVVGATPAYETVNNIPVESGVFFDEAALRAKSRVALLGSTVIKNLFEDEDAVGKIVKINRIAFTVIGTIKERGGTQWFDPDDLVIVPLTTAQGRLYGTDDLSGINVKVVGEVHADDAVVQVEEVLRRRHRLGESQENDFVIRNQADIISVYGETARTMTFLLAGIACVSLVVGGIGIMNIMLVSVAERTREIGTRIAVGARRRDILAQFVLEAVVTSLAGGLIGILVGVFGSKMLSAIAGWSTAISLAGIGLSFLFAAGIGLFFGIYPARRAAMLDPIAALHYE